MPNTQYQLWFFGLPLFIFPINSVIGFVIFHGLDFSAALLLIGLAIALWRRIYDAGLLVIQRFGFDLVPVVLLVAIAVTGTHRLVNLVGRKVLLVPVPGAPGSRSDLATHNSVR